MADNDKKTPVLTKKIIIKGEITLESGMLIGASNNLLEIGGTDKQVIRHPINKLPYIPGSSLKGKMRSLFELHNGQIDAEGKGFGPTHNPEHMAAKLFGYINKNPAKKQRPSRVLVRDCNFLNPDKFDNTELLYTEVKAENSIDRITSEANPRFFERVPKGARFDLLMALNVFEGEKQEEFLGAIFQALRLLKDDYIGMGGSRGNGQISLKLTSMCIRDKAFYESDKGDETDISSQLPKDLLN